MSTRNFTSRPFITGALLLTTMTVLVVWLCYIVYGWIGYTFITWLTVAFAGFYSWQAVYFHKNPDRYRAYLIRLHKAFWTFSKAGPLSILMYIINGAALMALLLHGWWIATLGAVIMSLIVIRHIQKAEFIHVTSSL